MRKLTGLTETMLRFYDKEQEHKDALNEIDKDTRAGMSDQRAVMGLVLDGLKWRQQERKK